MKQSKIPTRKGPLQKKATRFLKLLEKGIKEARNFTDPIGGIKWQNPIQRRLHGLKSQLESLGNPKTLITNITPRQILEEWYKDLKGIAEDLDLSELEAAEPKYKEELRAMKKTIDALPAEYPKNQEEFLALNLDIEPLLTSLWEGIEAENEENQISFDLGDDGTDEMEQALEELYWLLQIYTKEADQTRLGKSFDANPIWIMVYWYIKDYYLQEEPRLNPMRRLEYNLHNAASIFQLMADTEFYDDAFALFITDLAKELDLIPR